MLRKVKGGRLAARVQRTGEQRVRSERRPVQPVRLADGHEIGRVEELADRDLVAVHDLVRSRSTAGGRLDESDAGIDVPRTRGLGHVRVRGVRGRAGAELPQCGELPRLSG